MILARTPAAALLIALATLPCLAQTPSQTPPQTPHQTVSSPSQPSTPAPPPTGPLNRMVVVLDPAHGGVDNGSRIGDSTLEKTVTLALAFKLRSLLSARGFTVVLTRDSDSPVEPGPAAAPLTLDDRAGIANHARAVACLTLHATGAGQGVHLYSSELAPAPGEAAILPWLTAQAVGVTQSRALARRVGDALTRAGIPLVLSNASIRPVDSLTCPALVVEVAPESDDPASVSDSGYQQRIAQAVAAALPFWSTEAEPPVRLPAPTPATSRNASSTAAGDQP